STSFRTSLASPGGGGGGGGDPDDSHVSMIRSVAEGSTSMRPVAPSNVVQPTPARSSTEVSPRPGSPLGPAGPAVPGGPASPLGAAGPAAPTGPAAPGGPSTFQATCVSRFLHAFGSKTMRTRPCRLSRQASIVFGPSAAAVAMVAAPMSTA